MLQSYLFLSFKTGYMAHIASSHSEIGNYVFYFSHFKQAIAQLVERVVRDHEAGGSSPLSLTNKVRRDERT